MRRYSIDKLRAGNEHEWRRLAEEYTPRIYAYLKKQVGEHQTAEDLTQETFLGAVRGMSRFEGRYTLEQFLFGIAKNRLIDFYRKWRPALISEDDAGHEPDNPIERLAAYRRTPDDSAAAREMAEAKRNAIADVLKSFVRELWGAGQFRKLKILEFLFAFGGRNKEAARRFQLGDERAVARIKFRAIERLRCLARQRDPEHELFEGLWMPGAR